MQSNNFTLFVEINFSNYLISVCESDESQKFKIIEEIVVSNKDIQNNRFKSIENPQDVIKKNIQILEDKLNFVFKDVILIIDVFKYSSLNISGSKKLNGSQILKENISYILNSLKLTISEIEKDKVILQIFNSKSILDGATLENLPIGLFGDFYSHELTFFLLNNNDFKNIQQIFNMSNLNVKKIMIKNFIEGTQIINQYKKNETFFKVKIYKDNSSISFFDNASFKHFESFNFGTNIILSDISKVCSIEHPVIESIFSDLIFCNNTFKENEYLEEKYFTKKNYRKIRKNLITEIVKARVEEFVDIIYKKNINLHSFKKRNSEIYLNVEDKLVSENFKSLFKECFLKAENMKIHFVNELTKREILEQALQLSNYGWKKEAIPIVQTKSSLITRIFKSFFG